MSSLTIVGLIFTGFMFVLAIFAHIGRVHSERTKTEGQ